MDLHECTSPEGAATPLSSLPNNSDLLFQSLWFLEVEIMDFCHFALTVGNISNALVSFMRDSDCSTDLQSLLEQEPSDYLKAGQGLR